MSFQHPADGPPSHLPPPYDPTSAVQPSSDQAPTAAPYGPPPTAGPPSYGQAPPAAHYGPPPTAGPPSYGQTPYAPQYGPASTAWGAPPRPVAQGLATATSVLAWVVAAVIVVQFLVSVPAVSTLNSLMAGDFVATGVLDAYDALSSLSLVIQIAAAVVTIVWLWRSRTFAEAVTPGWPHARSKVWVWLGWMVPVVALWFPFQVVRDVRAATLRESRAGLGGWWASWLVFGFASNAGANILSSENSDVWLALPFFDGIAAVAVVVAAALWSKIVREVSAGQRAASIGTPAPVQAPAPGWS